MENGGEKKNNGLSWSGQQNKPVMPSQTNATVSPAPVGNRTARYAAFLVGGVVVVVLIAWGAGWRKAPAGDKAATVNGSNDSALNTDGVSMPAEGSDPGLLIMTPQAAGTSVQITKAIVNEPTWVVVYENNAGTPGNALGAALFFPERQAGTVELLRATVAGKSYLVVKQVDNGDRKFSLRGDPIVTEGGEAQWVTFAAN